MTDVPEDLYNSDSDDEGMFRLQRKNVAESSSHDKVSFCIVLSKKSIFRKTFGASLWCGSAYCEPNFCTVDKLHVLVLKIWPDMHLAIKGAQAPLPADFEEKFPTTRVIIDCMEVRCKIPSNLLLNSELFSSYKNHATLKGLVGIPPPPPQVVQLPSVTSFTSGNNYLKWLIFTPTKDF